MSVKKKRIADQDGSYLWYVAGLPLAFAESDFSIHSAYDWAKIAGLAKCMVDTRHVVR